jgi:hypothetical protein
MAMGGRLVDGLYGVDVDYRGVGLVCTGEVRFLSLTSFFVGSDGNSTQCHISDANLQI